MTGKRGRFGKAASSFPRTLRCPARPQRMCALSPVCPPALIQLQLPVHGCHLKLAWGLTQGRRDQVAVPGWQPAAATLSWPQGWLELCSVSGEALPPSSSWTESPGAEDWRQVLTQGRSLTRAVTQEGGEAAGPLKGLCSSAKGPGLDPGLSPTSGPGGGDQQALDTQAEATLPAADLTVDMDAADPPQATTQPGRARILGPQGGVKGRPRSPGWQGL